MHPKHSIHILKQHTASWVILTLLLFVGCADSNDVSVYTIEKGDFNNIVKVQGLVEPVRSTNVLCPRGGDDGTIIFLIEDGVYVKEGETVCTIESQSLETYYNSQASRLEDLRAGLEKTKADLNMQYATLESQVRTNEAQTQIAHLDSLQLAYYSPNQKKIRELELKQVAIERDKFLKKLNALEIIQKSDIRKAEIEIQHVANQVESLKKELDGLTLTSPANGLAIRGRNPMTGEKYKVGDISWGNIAVVSIPEMESMKVKMEASETDYRYININDTVTFYFDAIPGVESYGKITHKLPVGKEYKRGSKVKFFEIEASIDSTSVIPEPGFTANCHIILKQVKDTIVVPQIAIYEEDSTKVVYVKNRQKFEVRPVVTAEVSSKEAVVTQGVHAGESVALRRPAESYIIRKKKKEIQTTDSLSLTSKDSLNISQHENKPDVEE